MAILSLDDYIAAARQHIQMFKNSTRTTVAGIPFSVFDLAGVPGAGTLAVGNTANGIVPNDTVAGYPPIGAFGGGNKGVIGAVHFSSSVACRLGVFDCLFSAGAFTFNANVTLASQPSYSSRVPGGTDFSNTELWLEAVTAFTGLQTVTITYTNQDGVTGRTTGAIATGVAPTAGRMFRVPLQAGDSGVQKIESVISTVSTVGTFNVHVMRRLINVRVASAYMSDSFDMLRSGLPEVFDNSALRLVVWADSTSSGAPEMSIEIANG